MIQLSTIKTWHVVISGFLQRQGAPNGMLSLATELHRTYAGPECMVEMRLWDESMAGLAEKIWLLRPQVGSRKSDVGGVCPVLQRTLSIVQARQHMDSCPTCQQRLARRRDAKASDLPAPTSDFPTTSDFPSIKIYGYSWGGAAAIRLAGELHKRGLPVDNLVLSDPVYRHWYWAGNWRAFWPFSKLYVPVNVARVDVFSQRQNLPSGHEVVALDPEQTIVTNRGVLGVNHQYMDDHPRFQNHALEVSK